MSKLTTYRRVQRKVRPVAPETFSTTYSAPATTRYVGSGYTTPNYSETQLQTAINDAATAGGNWTLILTAGETFTGNFTLPAGNSNWVYIISSDLASLPEGKRVWNTDSNHMPTVTCASAYSGQTLTTANAATKYRFAGIDIQNPGYNGDSYCMTFRGGDQVSSESNFPSYIWFDRCLMRCTNESNECEYGAWLDGKYMAIFDSYMYGFKTVGRDGGYCVKVANAPGPFKFVNNYKCSSGIGILFGGETVYYSGNVPRNVEFRRNVVTKNADWNGVFKVKNLFETKNVERLLVEGNIFRDCTYDVASQFATGLVLTVGGDTGTVNRLRDITIRKNLIRNVGYGLRFNGIFDSNAVIAQRITLENNQFDHISIAICTAANSFKLQNGISVLGDPSTDFVMDHNSFLFTTSGYNGGWFTTPDPDENHVIDRFTMTNNIIDENATYSGFASDGRAANVGQVTIDTMTLNPSVNKNVLIGIPAQWLIDYPTWFPSASSYYWGHAADHAAMYFTDETNHDFTIQAATTFKGFCPDGSDPGPNWTLLNAAIENTETGDWS